jgi:threonine/homoserine/homoserine lactone efflux protein
VAFFLFQTILISLTGVMAPGPITAATIGAGSRSPHAGAWIAVGHGVVEFPLMALVYFGLGSFLGEPAVRMFFFSLGGLFLLIMGADMLRSVRMAKEFRGTMAVTPVVTGIALSLGNAYFLLWWATVGASLITKAVAFGLIGIASFAVVHWLCDFGWLYTLSALSYRGRNLFGSGFQRVAFLICGIALIVFGMLFLNDVVRIWRD